MNRTSLRFVTSVCDLHTGQHHVILGAWLSRQAVQENVATCSWTLIHILHLMVPVYHWQSSWQPIIGRLPGFVGGQFKGAQQPFHEQWSINGASLHILAIVVLWHLSCQCVPWSDWLAVWGANSWVCPSLFIGSSNYFYWINYLWIIFICIWFTHIKF